MVESVPGPEMREIAELKAKVNLLLAMSSMADAELAHNREKISQITAEVEAKQQELVQLASQLSQKNEELKHRDEAINHRDEAINHRDEVVKQMDEAIKHRDEGIKHRDGVIKQMDEGIKLRDEALGRARAERADLERQILDAHANTQSIQNSTSWRITAPLRWLARNIKR